MNVIFKVKTFRDKVAGLAAYLLRYFISLQLTFILCNIVTINDYIDFFVDIAIMSAIIYKIELLTPIASKSKAVISNSLKPVSEPTPYLYSRVMAAVALYIYFLLAIVDVTSYQLRLTLCEYFISVVIVEFLGQDRKIVNTAPAVIKHRAFYNREPTLITKPINLENSGILSRKFQTVNLKNLSDR